MYFLEFLETCTIGWVLICEGGVGVGGTSPEKRLFFEKFYRGHDPPHPRRSLYTPPGGDPSPSAPGTATHHRQQGRPCQMQGKQRHAPTHTPGRWTRCTGLHSIQDRSHLLRVLEGGQCVRNCADLDAAQQRIKANTKKCAMLRVQLDANTKKCYYNVRNKRTLKSVTPPQNRRTKP